MLDHPEEAEYALRILDEVLREVPDDAQAAIIFQQRMVQPVAEKFMAIYHAGPAQGYVSIQGDPFDERVEAIIAQALDNRRVGANICCKIPTTAEGLEAMEHLIELDTPINATEIFGVAQLVALCERYQQVSQRCGKHPVLYISHIAGIYDDYLKQHAAELKADVSQDVLWQAGLAVARKVYQVMVERDYPGIFVGGGARGLHHFTEMVGGKVCITINWEGTADRLIEQNPPVVNRLFNPVPHRVIDELLEKLPDFKRGYLEDGLALEEFETFGPVILFRSSFEKSWRRVLQIIAERRAVLQTLV
jgi:transaldolase